MHDHVSLRGVSKSYGPTEVLHGIDLVVGQGEFFTLLGPSGSGKTTILRVIAGLTGSTSGVVQIGGRDATRLKPYERDVAVVFQTLALFPHMSVYDNVAFPLRMRRMGRREIAHRVGEALEMVRLGRTGSRRPEELSGGQRQRVALARALVYRPSLVLLDEPLAALDRRLREDMQMELAHLHAELGLTFINVTHDQREALMLSTRIGVVDQGRLVQVGTPHELYGSPATPAVARFLGDATIVSGHVLDGRMTVGSWDLAVRGPVRSGPTSIVLRSEVLRLSSERPPEDPRENSLAIVIASAAYEGSGMFYRGVIEGGDLEVAIATRATPDPALRAGGSAWISWHADDAPVIAGDL